jgi:small conductance mechanosensitive channel
MDLFTTEGIAYTIQNFVIPGIAALLLMIAAFLLASWVKRMTFRSLEKTKLDLTLTKFFSNFARYGILIIAVVAILGYLGIETASFAAVLAAAGFAIGLAFQGTLSNFSAGIMLLVFRPFRVGDVVTVDGVTGKVEEIELFTTHLNTFDNRRLIVPNGNIFGSTIENITFHEKRRVDVAVGTDYGADLNETRQTLTEAATGVEGRLVEDDVQIVLMGLGDSAIDWEVRIWSPTSDYLVVRDRLTQAVKDRLDAAGIGIPFPQRDLHLDGALGSLN